MFKNRDKETCKTGYLNYNLDPPQSWTQTEIAMPPLPWENVSPDGSGLMENSGFRSS